MVDERPDLKTTEIYATRFAVNATEVDVGSLSRDRLPMYFSPEMIILALPWT